MNELYMIRARKLCEIFGGNGLSANQQIVMAAEMLESWADPNAPVPEWVFRTKEPKLDPGELDHLRTLQAKLNPEILKTTDEASRLRDAIDHLKKTP